MAAELYGDENIPPLDCILDQKLYLGNWLAASALHLLRDLRVTHVVNAAEEQPNFFPEDLVYYNCNLRDDLTETIDFEAPVWFIRQAIAHGGVVFVHCTAGISRSTSIVVAYLMKTHQLSLAEALLRVSRCRPVVNPNPNFLRQLVHLETSLFGQASLDLNEYSAGRLGEAPPFLNRTSAGQLLNRTEGDFDQALSVGLEQGSVFSF